jgi:hypothetical protein
LAGLVGHLDGFLGIVALVGFYGTLRLAGPVMILAPILGPFVATDHSRLDHNAGCGCKIGERVSIAVSTGRGGSVRRSPSRIPSGLNRFGN